MKKTYTRTNLSRNAVLKKLNLIFQDLTSSYCSYQITSYTDN